MEMDVRTSTRQDKEFISDLVTESLLADAIGWIKHEFSLEELHGIDVLSEWALENGFIRNPEDE